MCVAKTDDVTRWGDPTESFVIKTVLQCGGAVQAGQVTASVGRAPGSCAYGVVQGAAL